MPSLQLIERYLHTRPCAAWIEPTWISAGFSRARTRGRNRQNEGRCLVCRFICQRRADANNLRHPINSGNGHQTCLWHPGFSIARAGPGGRAPRQPRDDAVIARRSNHHPFPMPMPSRKLAGGLFAVSPSVEDGTLPGGNIAATCRRHHPQVLMVKALWYSSGATSRIALCLLIPSSLPINLLTKWISILEGGREGPPSSATLAPH